MTPPTKHIDAAARLGVPVNEVTKVEDSPAGLIITTFDGVRYVDVPESTPDAAGRSGLMLLVAPTKTYGGSLPVYSQPGAEADVDDDAVPVARADLRSEIIQVLEGLGLLGNAVDDRLATVEGRLDRLDSAARVAEASSTAPATDPVPDAKTPDAGFERPTPAPKPPKSAKRQGA